MDKRVLVAGLLLLPAVGWTEGGIPIEPGLWRVTTTMEMPMLTEPRVETSEQCMDADELSPETFSSEDQAGCTFDAQVDGNTMTWSMECEQYGTVSTGEWEATTDGDTVTGGGVITTAFQGQEMTMNMSWEGERVGDCEY